MEIIIPHAADVCQRKTVKGMYEPQCYSNGNTETKLLAQHILITNTPYVVYYVATHVGMFVIMPLQVVEG